MNDYEEFKERAMGIIDHDPSTVKAIFITALVAGMELSMRICRNRAEDIEILGSDFGNKRQARSAKEQAEICATLIRNMQVEIGSGRAPLPTFTKLELSEMNRIA